MFSRTKWLIPILVIILIPILLGIMPLNFIHKLGSGCPFHQANQIQKCSPSLFHSLISHDDHLIGIHFWASIERETIFPSLFPSTSNSDFPSLAVPSKFSPLRC